MPGLRAPVRVDLEVTSPPGIRDFDDPACVRCGECLHHCPELHLPKDVAKEEIEALRRGEDGRFVLRHCTTCFSCNL